MSSRSSGSQDTVLAAMVVFVFAAEQLVCVCVREEKCAGSRLMCETETDTVKWGGQVKRTRECIR